MLRSALRSAEWRSRTYLPHFDQPGSVQMITFRLADSLPVEVVAQLLRDYPRPDDPRRRQRFQDLLDAGHGACFLNRPAVAGLVQHALLHFDGDRYRLVAWVIMPNHVHVLVELMTGQSLAAVIHSWKSFTASQANRLLGRTGPFWQREYFDRAIRDERHLAASVNYIVGNPVTAGFVTAPGDWRFSSAGEHRLG